MVGAINLSIGELEHEVLESLWACTDAMTVRDVADRLKRPNDLAYTTVLTVLVRLHEKGLADRERDGRGYRYRPTLTREAFRARRALLALSVRGKPSTGVWMALLDSADDMDPGVLDRLSELIERRKRERG